MKPQHTKQQKATRKGVEQKPVKSQSNKASSSNHEVRRNGFVVLSKEEVEANRCQAYTYIM